MPRLLVFGSKDRWGEFVNSLERYDPSMNEWEGEAVAPMPTARKYVGTAVLDGKLYAVGGQHEAPPCATSNAVERYDLAAKSWEAVAPMPSARTYVRMAMLDGKLYAVGGESEADGAASNSVERYDLATNAWEAVAPMGTARQATAMA